MIPEKCFRKSRIGHPYPPIRVHTHTHTQSLTHSHTYSLTHTLLSTVCTCWLTSSLVEDTTGVLSWGIMSSRTHILTHILTQTYLTEHSVNMLVDIFTGWGHNGSVVMGHHEFSNTHSHTHTYTHTHTHTYLTEQSVYMLVDIFTGWGHNGSVVVGHHEFSNSYGLQQHGRRGGGEEDEVSIHLLWGCVVEENTQLLWTVH